LRKFAELIPQQHNIGALAHNICARTQRYTNMGCGERRGVVDLIADQDARPADCRRRFVGLLTWRDREWPEVGLRHNPVFGSKQSVQS
jgi:hypothetical protein